MGKKTYVKFIMNLQIVSATVQAIQNVKNVQLDDPQSMVAVEFKCEAMTQKDKTILTKHIPVTQMTQRKKQWNCYSFDFSLKSEITLVMDSDEKEIKPCLAIFRILWFAFDKGKLVNKGIPIAQDFQFNLSRYQSIGKQKLILPNNLYQQGDLPIQAEHIKTEISLIEATSAKGHTVAEVAYMDLQNQKQHENKVKVARRATTVQQEQNQEDSSSSDGECIVFTGAQIKDAIKHTAGGGTKTVQQEKRELKLKDLQPKAGQQNGGILKELVMTSAAPITSNEDSNKQREEFKQKSQQVIHLQLEVKKLRASCYKNDKQIKEQKIALEKSQKNEKDLQEKLKDLELYVLDLKEEIEIEQEAKAQLEAQLTSQTDCNYRDEMFF